MQNSARTHDRIDALVTAFTAAEYVVDAGGDTIVIKVGDSTPALDSLLGESPWAVITAYNPDGLLCSADTNTAAQRSLESNLREQRPAALFRVSNRDPEGLWPEEPAWLFTPNSISQVDRLARRFGQRAVLIGRPGGSAQLRIYAETHEAIGTTPGAVS